MRRGRVVERVDLVADTGSEDPPVRGARRLQATLQQFYADREAPPEVHLPLELPDAESLETWLSARAGRRVRVLVPKRGDKRGLLDLAARNAEQAYQARFNQGDAAHYDGLEMLRVALGLPALPRRIECFDISTIQGSETVASMVVCEDGRMKRSEYRKFRLAPDRRAGGRPVAGPARRALVSSTTSPRCTRWCSDGTAACWRQGDRSRT